MLIEKTRKPILFAASVFIAFSVSASGMIRVTAEEDGWTDQGTVTYAAVNPYYGGWSNCTWSAWQLCYDYTGIALPRLGNAGAWYGAAASYGYAVGTAPAAMSVGVWSNHVVFVTEVSEDGSMVYIKEGGYCGGYHEGWIPSQSNRNGQIFYGYIYVGSGGAVINPTPIITTTTTVNEETGEVISTQTQTVAGVTKIEFPEVTEDVVRVDDAVSTEVIKTEEQQAKEEELKENREQRAAAVASKSKLLCD